jgi:hypothetical protein
MYSAQIRLDVNPHVAVALDQLGVLLDDYGYSAHAKARIWAYTAQNGTPTGCRYLDREDEADASMVFEESLPAVPYDSEAWDKEDVFLDARMLAAGTHPLPFGEGPDAPDGDPQVRFAGIESLAERMSLPPVSGGAPEFIPSAADLQEYGVWSEELDRRRSWDEQTAAWNDERWDAGDRPA